MSVGILIIKVIILRPGVSPKGTNSKT